MKRSLLIDRFWISEICVAPMPSKCFAGREISGDVAFSCWHFKFKHSFSKDCPKFKRLVIRPFFDPKNRLDLHRMQNLCCPILRLHCLGFAVEQFLFMSFWVGKLWQAMCAYNDKPQHRNPTPPIPCLVETATYVSSSAGKEKFEFRIV